MIITLDFIRKYLAKIEGRLRTCRYEPLDTERGRKFNKRRLGKVKSQIENIKKWVKDAGMNNRQIYFFKRKIKKAESNYLFEIQKLQRMNFISSIDTNEKSDLTVITVMENDNGLIYNMLDSIFKFTKPIPNIIICDNANNKELKAMYRDNKYIKVIKNKTKVTNTSLRHGSGLNKIFPLVKTKLTAIVESDCVVLKNDWDQIKPGCKIVAARKGGNVGGYYYHVCFMVFYTDIMKQNAIINFKPDLNGYGIDIGGKKYNDVGWRIYEKVKDDEVDLLNTVSCTLGKCKYFSDDLNYKTFELWKDNEPIAAHFGRGSEVERRGKNFAKDLFEWKETVKKILMGKKIR